MNPKSIVLVASAVLSFVSGMVDQYFYPGMTHPPTAIASVVVLTLLLFAWYRLDSDERGYRRSIGLNVAVIGLAIVGLPYYFFRSRGAKRGFIATGLALVAMVLSGALSTAGGFATYYGLQA